MTRPSAIYGIENVKTGERYVGAARDMRARVLDHFSMLRKKKHYNKKLQASYNRHGWRGFRAVYLEFEPADLNAIESFNWRAEREAFHAAASQVSLNIAPIPKPRYNWFVSAQGYMTCSDPTLDPNWFSGVWEWEPDLW